MAQNKPYAAVNDYPRRMIRIRFRTGIQNNQIHILFSNRYLEHLDTRSFQSSIQNIDTGTKVDAG